MTAEDAEDLVRLVISKVEEQRRPIQIQVEVIADVPATVIDEQSDIVQAILGAARNILGKELRLFVSGRANESYIRNSLKIATCIIGPEGRRVHAPDEYVVIDSIFSTAELYAEAAGSLHNNQGAGPLPTPVTLVMIEDRKL